MIDSTGQIVDIKIEYTPLHALAKGLIEYETLSGDEIIELLRDGKISRPDPEVEIKNAGSSVPKSGKTSSPISPDLKPKPTG